MPLGTVLIVPGFSGNELWTPRSFFGLGPQIKVWLNYTGLVAGSWRWLALAPDGVTPTFPGVGAIYAGLPLPDYYGQIATYLEKQGWTVFGAMLDWRELLTLDGQRLSDTVVSLAAQAPIHIVAHSRGGLVTRSALQILSQAGKLALVGRVAGLGVPHEGTWEAAALLSGFQSWSRLTRNLLESAPGAPTGSLLFGSFQQMVISWPAIYQLLPAPFASGVDPSILAAIYDAGQWAAIGRPVSGPWLDAAHQAWTLLPAPPANVTWLDVIGYGVQTATTLRVPTPPLRSTDAIYSFDGDGLVPIAWATQTGRVRISSPTAHHALPYDGRILPLLGAYLQNGQQADITITGPVLQ